MTIEGCLTGLLRVADRLQSSLAKSGLEGRAGYYLDSAVLKLQKPGWAEAIPGAEKANRGIFFAVWVERKQLARGRVWYNIHSLRMGEFPGHVIKPVKFAAAFRAELAEGKAGWPNVSVDHGPQTLMKGWIGLSEATFEEDVARLARRFVPLAGTIDELLKQNRKHRA
jgi:hypothetical protein